MSSTPPLWAVIMAGGSGTRFWPASTERRPKQLSRILGGRTMLQQTVDRVATVADQVLVVTTADLVDESRRQLPDLDPARVIGEPVGRDTAPCVALAAQIVQAESPGAVMVLLPADHVIEPDDIFARSLRAGAAAAEEGHLVTFGVLPRFPATGYGYLHAVDQLAGHDDVLMVRRFVEKPHEATAEGYLTVGGYYWNSGIFAWRAAVVLEQLEQHCPQLSEAMAPVGAAWRHGSIDDALTSAYDAVESVSIDYALMEHATDVVMVVAEWDWDDLGSWDAVYHHLDVDPTDTAVSGDVMPIDCHDSLLFQLDGPPVVGIGLDDLIVVSTANGVLVLPRGRGQEVRQAVERLREQGRDDLL